VGTLLGDENPSRFSQDLDQTTDLVAHDEALTKFCRRLETIPATREELLKKKEKKADKKLTISKKTKTKKRRVG
jgi:hypothetical protein